jgi:biotin transport system substrate-specific component
VIYLPGDLVKMVLAALVARAVHSAMPDLLPAREESGDEVAVDA